MVSKAELEIIINAIISSCVEYWNSLFTSLNKNKLGHLLVAQSSAARLLTRTSKRAHHPDFSITSLVTSSF